MAEPAFTWPGAEWESATPASLGLDPASLADAGSALANPGSNALAFVVVKDGKIAWEQYYEGAGRPDRHHLFSVTKSFLSALVGLALGAGVLASLEQPIADFFPEFPLPASSPARVLTLRHLLTMTTGWLWPLGGGAFEKMVDRLRRSPNWAYFILALPVRPGETGRFHYCSAASHLLSAILTRATGQSACEFARQRFFARVEIGEVRPGQDWEADPQGNSLGGWGLHLSAREVARLGWLYVTAGVWQGQALLPDGWAEESTSRPPGSPSPYGYHWWLRSMSPGRAFAGLGRGGQYLYCAPERRLVAVILSRGVAHPPERWGLLEGLVKN
jgi:CubicO group peptidase (beta-lactamase class C family)